LPSRAGDAATCQISAGPRRMAHLARPLGPAERGRRRTLAVPRSGGFFCAYPLPSRVPGAVVRINEDTAGLFERTLNCLDGAWPHRAPALEAPHCGRRHYGRAGQVTHGPSKGRSRHRLSNLTPSLASSCRIEWLTAGAVSSNRSAAARKLRCSATAEAGHVGRGTRFARSLWNLGTGNR
jgi:hypothetical protein